MVSDAVHPIDRLAFDSPGRSYAAAQLLLDFADLLREPFAAGFENGVSQPTRLVDCLLGRAFGAQDFAADALNRFARLQIDRTGLIIALNRERLPRSLQRSIGRNVGRLALCRETGERLFMLDDRGFLPGAKIAIDRLRRSGALCHQLPHFAIGTFLALEQAQPGHGSLVEQFRKSGRSEFIAERAVGAGRAFSGIPPRSDG